MTTEKLSHRLDVLRMEILAKGYDHKLEYDALDCLFDLVNKIRKIENEETNDTTKT